MCKLWIIFNLKILLNSLTKFRTKLLRRCNKIIRTEKDATRNSNLTVFIPNKKRNY